MLRERADRGDPGALYVLACIYDDGWNAGARVVIPPDRRLSQQYMAEAAGHREPNAMMELGNQLLDSGQWLRARTMYERAYRGGYATAAFNLANAYQNRGEYHLAVRWFEKALNGGDISALLPLARAELYGLGTRRNTRSAFAKLKRAAASKAEYGPAHWFQAEAMLVMASALLVGWPVPRDVPTATRWLQRAAALGNQAAAAMLEQPITL